MVQNENKCQWPFGPPAAATDLRIGWQMTDAPDGFRLCEQIAHIDRMLADAARQRQEVTNQPWTFMLSGMTAGAALFAAGAAVCELFA